MVRERVPTILVVDDETDTCANLRDILMDFGYCVEVAHHGDEALALLRQRHFDIALLDLRMPGIDGLELYRRMRQTGGGTVGIIITAYASREVTAEAIEAGAWQILSKPVDVQQLAALLDEALDKPPILVVDDDRSLCNSMVDVLEEQGFRACVADSLATTTERLRDRWYDVVLIDMKLPEGTGDDVYHLVRNANPEARTILITGFRDETQDLLSRLMQEGADAVCYKPFDMDQLLGAIRRLSQRQTHDH